MELRRCVFCGGRLYQKDDVWGCYGCRQAYHCGPEDVRWKERYPDLLHMYPSKVQRHFFSQKPRRIWYCAPAVIGLREDGTVLCTARDGDTSAVLKWKDIVSISASLLYVAGVKFDGTVVTTAPKKCWDVSRWRNIMYVSVGSAHIVGLKYDGTVVAAGDNRFGQCEVSGWEDVVAIGTNPFHTFGLTRDGKMLMTGIGQKEREKGLARLDDRPECKAAFIHVSHWGSLWTGGTDFRHLRDFAFETDYGVCVSSDGRVWYSDIARKPLPSPDVVQSRTFKQFFEIHRWRDITAVAMSIWNIIGIREDGTVVAAGKNVDGRCDIVAEWTEIVDVYADAAGFLGLRADGTVVQAPANAYSRDLNSWKLFDSVPSLARNINRPFHQERFSLGSRIEQLRREIPRVSILNVPKKRRMINELKELESRKQVMWDEIHR